VRGSREREKEKKSGEILETASPALTCITCTAGGFFTTEPPREPRLD